MVRQNRKLRRLTDYAISFPWALIVSRLCPVVVLEDLRTCFECTRMQLLRNFQVQMTSVAKAG